MKTIVFSRGKLINGWMGTLPGRKPKPLVFPETTSGTVYAYMCQHHPEYRVGFRAKDFSPAMEQIYGEVIWMKEPMKQSA